MRVGLAERKDKTEKVTPRGGEKSRSQNGNGGVTTDALCDNCEGEWKEQHMGALMVPCKSISHPLNKMIRASKCTLIRNSINYYLQKLFAQKA